MRKPRHTRGGWAKPFQRKRNFIVRLTALRKALSASIPGVMKCLENTTAISIFKDGTLCPREVSRGARVLLVYRIWSATAGSGLARSLDLLKASLRFLFIPDTLRIFLTAGITSLR